MIDDKEKYLHQIKEALHPEIEFIGIRYSFLDDKVVNFDPIFSRPRKTSLFSNHITQKNKFMKITAYFLNFCLILSFNSTFATKKPSLARHYATHLITERSVNYIGCLSLNALIKLMLHSCLKNKHIELAIISGLIGSITTFYIVYKTPQWTDKFILHYATERTTTQNIITLACRAFIPFPFGTLLGELEFESLS